MTEAKPFAQFDAMTGDLADHQPRRSADMTGGTKAANPLQRMVAWFSQSDAAHRKASTDLQNMIDRLGKLSPHLLDDIGVVTDPERIGRSDQWAMPDGTRVAGKFNPDLSAPTPLGFYICEQFKSK